VTGKFESVAKVGDIKEGSPLLINLGELKLALCKVENIIYAIENVCSHDEGALVENNANEGDCDCLDGHEIKCPRHGARFDVRDGSVLSMPAAFPIRTFDVKVEDEQIFVKVDSDG
jgi:3-phenylpropionate/trans-cinnamate dioxygenase ferredoxin subunit